MLLFRHITSNPAICSGKPVFAGTRIPVDQVLLQLAEGESFDEILADYPTVSIQAIRESLKYAAYMNSFTEYTNPVYA